MQRTRHNTTSDVAPDVVQRTCFRAKPLDVDATRPTDATTSVCCTHSRVPAQFHSVRRVFRDRQTRHREVVCAPDRQTRPVLSRVTRLSRYAAPHLNARAATHDRRNNSVMHGVCRGHVPASITPARTSRARVWRQTPHPASVASKLSVCRSFVRDASSKTRSA
jgi:hypothetical protein